MLYNEPMLSSPFTAVKEHKCIPPIVTTPIKNKWEVKCKDH